MICERCSHTTQQAKKDESCSSENERSIAEQNNREHHESTTMNDLDQVTTKIMIVGWVDVLR